MQFRTKTVLGVAIIEIVLLAVLVGSVLSILRESNESELTRRVQLGGKLLTAAAKDAVISQDLATLDSLADEAMASGQIDFVRILDASGAVLTKRGDTAYLSRPFHSEARIDQVTDGIFDWSAPVMAGGVRHGEVRLGVSTDPLKVLLASARRWAAGIAGLEILLVAVFSWLLGSYLVRQLVALRSASQRLAAGDFGQRMTVQGDDELAETALAFNRMAHEIGESQALLVHENLRRIEAQQNAELAQSRAEDQSEQLDAIFALSPDGLVCFDTSRCVKYANPAFLRLTGFAQPEVIGMDENAFTARLARACHPRARFPGVAALHALRDTGSAAAQTAAAAHSRSGRRQLIELTGANQRVLEVGMRISNTASVSQILYFRDVTHETEVDRLKSEFLATAAHELRTPMTSIYGFAELLLTREFDAADRHEFLSTIVKQSKLTVSILNELLDLTRIEERRGKDFDIARIDLCDLMDEILAGFRPPDERGAPARSPADKPLWVSADRGKLTQAVVNVLSNAYKYSLPGSPVQIDLERFAGDGDKDADDKDAGDKGARIRIRVTDRGIGMTPEQLHRVGERFYRADTSGRIPGTGLGMSIVREIVELHGGTLELASAKGEGTTVSLWIPADAEAAPA